MCAAKIAIDLAHNPNHHQLPTTLLTCYMPIISCRFRREYTLLLGIFYSANRPLMNKYLRPILDDLIIEMVSVQMHVFTQHSHYLSLGITVETPAGSMGITLFCRPTSTCYDMQYEAVEWGAWLPVLHGAGNNRGRGPPPSLLAPHHISTETSLSPKC